MLRVDLDPIPKCYTFEGLLRAVEFFTKILSDHFKIGTYVPTKCRINFIIIRSLCEIQINLKYYGKNKNPLYVSQLILHNLYLSRIL